MRETQIFIAYITFIVVAEGVTSFVDPVYGFSLHSLILISLLVLSSLKNGENPSSKLYLSLSLAPLIRIISLSMPLTIFPRYVGYVVVYIPVLVATVASKEIATAETRQTLQAFGGALTIGILPLLISFTLIVSFKVLEVLY